MKVKNYKSVLHKQLRDLKFVAGYLSECLKQGEDVFLLALRDVIEVHGGIGELAKKSKLNRESLYRVLSNKGNPKLSSLSAILEHLGIEMQFKKRA